ncbi:hypothetical protein [Burkholderia sp. AU6039]|nr:hypothetical protein [Burkholderia sp. AU6039]
MTAPEKHRAYTLDPIRKIQDFVVDDNFFLSLGGWPGTPRFFRILIGHS